MIGLSHESQLVAGITSYTLVLDLQIQVEIFVAWSRLGEGFVEHSDVTCASS